MPRLRTEIDPLFVIPLEKVEVLSLALAIHAA
jgi:hypothetical protein